MYPHRIRLAAPWERHELPTGRVQFRRRFGRPRQLDDWERVWILAPAAVRKQTWKLNDTELCWCARSDDVARAAVTPLLRDRNELIIECDIDSKFEGAVLEIGSRAWIQDVRAQVQSAEMLVVVDVQSESAVDPLELYLSVRGENQGYSGPFEHMGRRRVEFRVPDAGQSSSMQGELGVELICRSNVWDRCEIDFACE